MRRAEHRIPSQPAKMSPVMRALQSHAADGEASLRQTRAHGQHQNGCELKSDEVFHVVVYRRVRSMPQYLYCKVRLF